MLLGISVGQDPQVSSVRPPAMRVAYPAGGKAVHGGWGLIVSEQGFSTGGDLETGCCWGALLHLVGRGQGYCSTSYKGPPPTPTAPLQQRMLHIKCQSAKGKSLGCWGWGLG